MNKKYLELLSKDFPTIDSAASEIVNLSAIRSLPKGTEYFFSDMHGEYEAFIHMLRSASGMIKNKIDITLEKTVSSTEREALANLIYYPDKELKRLRREGVIDDEPAEYQDSDDRYGQQGRKEPSQQGGDASKDDDGGDAEDDPGQAAL